MGFSEVSAILSIIPLLATVKSISASKPELESTTVLRTPSQTLLASGSAAFSASLEESSAASSTGLSSDCSSAGSSSDCSSTGSRSVCSWSALSSEAASAPSRSASSSGFAYLSSAASAAFLSEIFLTASAVCGAT